MIKCSFWVSAGPGRTVRRSAHNIGRIWFWSVSLQWIQRTFKNQNRSITFRVINILKLLKILTGFRACPACVGMIAPLYRILNIVSDVTVHHTRKAKIKWGVTGSKSKQSRDGADISLLGMIVPLYRFLNILSDVTVHHTRKAKIKWEVTGSKSKRRRVGRIMN